VGPELVLVHFGREQSYCLSGIELWFLIPAHSVVTMLTMLFHLLLRKN